MGEYKKPLPKPTLDTKPYWDAAKRHELVIQRCKDCGTSLKRNKMKSKRG